MDRRVRVLLAVIAVAQVIAGALFILQVPWVTGLWPFPGTTEMSNIFIASIFMAAAAATGWCLIERSDRAFAGLALDYVVILVPLGLACLVLALDDGGLHAAAFGLVSLVSAAFGAWLLRWALSRPWRTADPTPRLVLVAFATFIVVLLILGTLLVLQVPGILPWAITPQLSTVYGCMFVGAAAYFAYGLVDRRWENAGGQLAGFLAYDLVLIVPFLARIATGAPSYYGTASEPLRLNLIVYALVVTITGALGFYYLFIDPRTSIQARRRSQAVGNVPG